MADKRISQLNSHTSPTGSDLLVIVNNNETKKITYADLVAQITGSETDLTLLNQFTQSIDGRVDSLESWSSSLDSTFATDLQVSIVSSSVAATIGVISQNTGLLSTSSFNQYTASISTGSLVDRLDLIESVTSSYETKGSGILSGSVSYTSLTDIPTGIVSQSTDLSSLNAFTASYFTDSASVDSRLDILQSWSSSLTDTFATDLEVSIVSSSVAATIGIISQNTGLVSTSSFNSFTQSIDGRVDSLENATSSYLTSLNGAISSSSQLTSSFDIRYTLSGSVTQTTWDNISGKPNGIVSQSTDLTQLNQFTQSIDGRVDSLENATGSYITSLNGTISGSSQLTSSYDTRYTLSGSVQPLPNGVISGSSQLTSSFDERYTLSGSVVSGTTPAGTISGSSQLTASFDVRYSLSGSGGGTTPAGTVSGSSQLTSSYDGRYLLTQSFNSFTASAQTVTTGSNSFNGTQTITGSLIITTGSFIGSQITANTSSLYLTSGSNMYVQNNGLVEITGSLNVTNTTTLKGSVNIGTGSGLEGGEIQLAYAQMGNTTLTGSAIAFDVYADRIRIFEGGGTNRGAFLNIASQSVGVGSEIVTSPNVSTIQTLTSASYAAITPVSGTLYIIIG
jgi:hypothetical protein